MPSTVKAEKDRKELELEDGIERAQKLIEEKRKLLLMAEYALKGANVNIRLAKECIEKETAALEIKVAAPEEKGMAQTRVRELMALRTAIQDAKNELNSKNELLPQLKESIAQAETNLAAAKLKLEQATKKLEDYKASKLPMSYDLQLADPVATLKALKSRLSETKEDIMGYLVVSHGIFVCMPQIKDQDYKQTIDNLLRLLELKKEDLFEPGIFIFKMTHTVSLDTSKNLTFVDSDGQPLSPNSLPSELNPELYGRAIKDLAVVSTLINTLVNTKETGEKFYEELNAQHVENFTPSVLSDNEGGVSVVDSNQVANENKGNGITLTPPVMSGAVENVSEQTVSSDVNDVDLQPKVSSLTVVETSVDSAATGTAITSAAITPSLTAAPSAEQRDLTNPDEGDDEDVYFVNDPDNNPKSPPVSNWTGFLKILTFGGVTGIFSWLLAAKLAAIAGVSSAIVPVLVPIAVGGALLGGYFFAKKCVFPTPPAQDLAPELAPGRGI